MSDLRKTALMNSLRRLNIRQLKRIKSWQGLFHHGDKAYDEQSGTYHPIAIAIGIPDIKGFIPTEQTVTRQLSFCRLSVKPLPVGEECTFYTDNAQKDLLTAVDELIEEKRSEETN